MWHRASLWWLIGPGGTGGLFKYPFGRLLEGARVLGLCLSWASMVEVLDRTAAVQRLCACDAPPPPNGMLLVRLLVR